MTLLEHAGWWALVAVAIVVAIALNSCGNSGTGLNRPDAIDYMRRACAEHRLVKDWHDRTIDSFTGSIDWICNDGTVGSKEYDS